MHTLHRCLQFACIAIVLSHFCKQHCLAQNSGSSNPSQNSKLRELSRDEIDADERKRTEPQADDSTVNVIDSDGRPVRNAKVSLWIERTYGHFSGSGNPPQMARTPSNKLGEVRFDRANDFTKRLENQIETTRKTLNTSNGRLAETQKTTSVGSATPDEMAAFRAFRWTLEGYWPSANCRIILSETGKPKLWCQTTEPVKIQLPKFHHVAILVLGLETGSPIAQSHVTLFNPFDLAKNTFGSKIYAHAWTDPFGVARFWVPAGSYQFGFNNIIAGPGAQSDTKLIKKESVPDFGIFIEKFAGPSVYPLDLAAINLFEDAKIEVPSQTDANRMKHSDFVYTMRISDLQTRLP